MKIPKCKHEIKYKQIGLSIAPFFYYLNDSAVRLKKNRLFNTILLFGYLFLPFFHINRSVSKAILSRYAYVCLQLVNLSFS